jgi:hypothetical protein
MESNTLSQLLKLPAGDRAELAMALWESLPTKSVTESLRSPKHKG